MALSCGEGGSTGSEVITQINTNETNIINSEIRVTALEALHDYIDDAQANILNVPEIYTAVASISQAMSSGRYLLQFSTTYNFDATNQSVFIRFNVNGDTTREYLIEPKDNTDSQPVSYPFPIDWVGGTFTATLEMRKETAANTLKVTAANIMLDKKKEL